jgi:hypothetical protein
MCIPYILQGCDLFSCEQGTSSGKWSRLRLVCHLHTHIHTYTHTYIHTTYIHKYIRTYKVYKYIHAFIHWSNMSRCIMCMYEWALLAQVYPIRLVYHSSDNANYLCSGQQVRASPIRSCLYIHIYVHTYIIQVYIHKYIHTNYIHTYTVTTQYLYPLCTIQGRYLLGRRHCRCGQQRYTRETVGTP